MKKKRFLKLVMSYGIQRDEAARMAARIGEFGSHVALYSSLRLSLALRQTETMVRRLGRTIQQVARAAIFPVFADLWRVRWILTKWPQSSAYFRTKWPSRPKMAAKKSNGKRGFRTWATKSRTVTISSKLSMMH